VSPHRTHGEVMLDGPEPLKKGPAEKCRGCAATPSKHSDGAYTSGSNLPAPVACAPAARVRVGWFRHCNVSGEHLHERCKVCGHRWLTAFAEGA
jgi:hypothetical protein